MGYIITNGSTYIKTMNNKAVVTNNRESAREFDSQIKAQNYCACLPGQFQSRGYYVKEAVPVDVYSSAPGAQFFPAESLDWSILDKDFVFEQIKAFEDLVTNLQTQKQQVTQQLSYAEACIFDIEHAIEISNCNARDGFKLYRLLREARILRRKCKDTLAIIAYIDETMSDDLKNHRASRRVAGLSRREFSPRAMPELFGYPEEVINDDK